MVGINLNTDNYIDDININIFSNRDKQIPITSITANNGIIFLSILNTGIFRIDYKNKQSEFVYKKMQKIELKNPQDIYHNEKDNELAIVDFDYGLIIINLSTGDAIGYRLPNDDVPNSLKFVNNFGNKFWNKISCFIKLLFYLMDFFSINTFRAIKYFYFCTFNFINETNKSFFGYHYCSFGSCANSIAQSL